MSDTELMKIFTSFMENLQLTKSKPKAYMDSEKIYFKGFNVWKCTEVVAILDLWSA